MGKWGQIVKKIVKANHNFHAKNVQKLYHKYILNNTYVFKVTIKLFYFGLTLLNIFRGYTTDNSTNNMFGTTHNKITQLKAINN